MSYTEDNKKLLNNIFKMTNLNKVDEDGNTYLHHLVGSGNKEYVKDFLLIVLLSQQLSLTSPPSPPTKLTSRSQHHQGG